MVELEQGNHGLVAVIVNPIVDDGLGLSGNVQGEGVGQALRHLLVKYS